MQTNLLDANGFVTTSKGRKIDKASSAARLRLAPVDFMSDEELGRIPTGSVFVFDVECYTNFFYVAFKELKSQKFVAFERSPDFNFEEMKLRWMLWRFCIVGFNSTSYDIPMLELAMKGLSCAELKEASDFIIKSGINYGTKKTTQFDIEKRYKVQFSKYNHIDLFNVCPVNGGVTANPASLKLYAARIHAPRLQDLPFPESHILNKEDAEIIRPYCCNDLENTELLFNELATELQLRVQMSEEYGLELRSKSDAQIAEAVINSELQKVLGYYPKKPTLDKASILQYKVPSFISYKSEQLCRIFEIVKNARFELDAMGSPIMPAELETLKVKIGSSTYKLGMGGLHSMEKKVAHVAKDGIMLADNDVESYYPKIILNQGLFPEHLGPAFLTVYGTIVETRITAKHKKNKKKANSLKIVINGSFGKFGNKYSTLYAPELMLQVTITGQLCLLMLIEMLEEAGISVISGNTDGVISKYHESRHKDVRAIITMWEERTAFKTEETLYPGVYSRDVNTYVAIKQEGDAEGRFLDEKLGVKTKGAFCERGSALNSILSKNPEALICADALILYLKNKTPIEKTIKECIDIRRFVCVKNVKGGGEKNGLYLGKVVRWYYPKNEAGYIAYVLSGNKVGKTDGARPLMDLPTLLPTDIDYDWYIRETEEMLCDCGAIRKAETKQINFFG